MEITNLYWSVPALYNVHKHTEMTQLNSYKTRKCIKCKNTVRQKSEDFVIAQHNLLSTVISVHIRYIAHVHLANQSQLSLTLLNVHELNNVLLL